MTKTLLRAGALSCALLASTALTSPAAAQSDVPAAPSPISIENDHNGVNLATGKMTIDGPVLSVPAAPHLRFDRVQNAAPYAQGNFGGGPNPTSRWRVQTNAGTSVPFQCQSNFCESSTGTGSTFLYDSSPDPNVPDVPEFRQGGSGERYYFDVRLYNIPGQVFFYASRVVWPNGEVITYTYQSGGLSGLPQYTYRRPTRIASNMGYHIDLTYPVEYMEEDIAGWSTPSSATLYRTSEPTVPLRRFTYGSGTITDSGSTISDTSDDRTYLCTGCGGSLSDRVETIQGALQLPGEPSPTLQLTPRSDNARVIQTVTRDGVPWTYSYANLHQEPGDSTWLYDSVTVNGPNGFNQVYTMTTASASPTSHYNVLTAVTAVSGAAGSPNRTTSYVIDPLSGRPLEATYPEGNRVGVTYDSAGNITSRTMYARPGSGASPATITEQAHYTLPTNPEFCDTSCWRPDWSKDALLRQTDYRYNANGQLTEMSEPADNNGVRRRTVNYYATSPSGISRRWRTRVCAVTSAPGAGLDTCNSYESTMTDFEYVGDTQLVSLERQWDMVTGASLETRHSYDAEGRLTSTDGPLPGTADTITYRYDAFGRRTWTIGPPDDNGVRQTARTSYRASDDKVAQVEAGAVTDPNATAFTTSFNRTDTAYDAHRNPARVTVSTPTGPGQAWEAQTLVERSFDDRSQLLCEARRLNRALFATPADACVPTAAGSDGPDQIQRNVYDNLGQRVQHRVGVGGGAGVEAADATWDYNLNGQITQVIDGNGNRARLAYDGHMRQSCWMFPSTTGPSGYDDSTPAQALLTAGNSSGTFDASGQCASGDYEAYGYDAAGNRLSWRKRDGSTLTFQYDSLNRMIVKVVPERPTGPQALTSAQTRDVYYGYDIRNQPLFARFDSTNGEGVTNSYDGFGRLYHSRLVMDGLSLPVGSRFDAGGRRTQVIQPDGMAFTYTYNAASQLTGIYEGDGLSTWLATFAYNGQGLVSARADRHGGGVAYGYDLLGRLTSQTNSLIGGPGTVTYALARTPSGQLGSQSRSSDLYAFAGANGSTVYAANGLNQYATVGGTTASYDANGNLTGDGQNSYVYDVENRLVSASGAHSASLVYDPLGRLFSVTGAGGTTRFVWDGDALINETNAAGTITAWYVHGANAGADDPLIWYEPSRLNFLYADPQGSIAAVSHYASAPRINTYDEYGIPGSGNTGRFQYTGQIWLPELGLYHYKARVYAPALGRFLQIDPVGYADQFNLYDYVGNDPVNGSDPTGLWDCSGTKEQCAQIRGYVNQFHVAARRAQSQTGSRISSPMARAMMAVSRHLGPETSLYGPTISAATIATPDNPTMGDTDPRSGNIRLDLRAISAAEAAGRYSGSGIVGHEGAHSLQYRIWGEPHTLSGYLRYETMAYSIQSYSDQMLGISTRLWNPAMSASTRVRRIGENARGSCEAEQWAAGQDSFRGQSCR